jgi:integration host factor subunit beta
MTKSDLIEQVATQLNLPKGKAELIINCIFDSMEESLRDGHRIEIRGFGSFEIRRYKAYEGRNPRTGDPVGVHPKRLPFFKVGKELKERVNAGGAEVRVVPAAAPAPAAPAAKDAKAVAAAVKAAPATAKAAPVVAKAAPAAPAAPAPAPAAAKAAPVAAKAAPVVVKAAPAAPAPVAVKAAPAAPAVAPAAAVKPAAVVAAPVVAAPAPAVAATPAAVKPKKKSDAKPKV